MKVLLDLQGAQTQGRTRGIGRYTMALARGIIKNAGDHEIWVGMTAGLPAPIVLIKEALADVLPEERMQVWSTVTPTGDSFPYNDGRLGQAQVVREAFINSLEPDLVHCSSVMEGAEENSVTSVNHHFQGPLTAATLFDFIPFIDPRYLQDQGLKRWYRRRLAELRRADLLLAISEWSQREGLEILGPSAERVVNIRTAADDIFVPMNVSAEREAELRSRYAITKPFVMYTGGVDPRKNVDGLIAAFAMLPPNLRESHQLVIVGSGHHEVNPVLLQQARDLGLPLNAVMLTGFVADEDIVALYNLSTAFVFPSRHEGFGLPPLEAMSCGTPTIAANSSSLPEVIGNPDALFDAYDTTAMAATMQRVLTDEAFRVGLARRGLEQSKTFSWDDTAKRALAAFEDLASSAHRRPSTPPPPFRPRLALVSPVPPRDTSARSQFLHLVDELDRYYQVDIVTDEDFSPGDFEGPARLLSPRTFDAVAGVYDRVVHHYANDPSFAFVRDVQALHPGTVLLDDYYLDRAVSTSSGRLGAVDAWADAVVESHGYHTLNRLLQARDAGMATTRVPLNTRVLETANGVIVTDPLIIEFAARDLGQDFVSDWIEVPLLAPAVLARPNHHEAPSIVAAFGNGSGQMHHRLVTAWLGSRISSDPSTELVIAGQRPDEPYGRLLTRMLTEAAPAAAWRFVTEDEAAQAIDRIRVAVRLGTVPDPVSRRWTTVCESRGIPLLVDSGVGLARDVTERALVAALEQAWDGEGDPHPKNSRSSAAQYRDAVEHLHAHGRAAERVAVLRVAAQQPMLDPDEWPRTVLAANRNHHVATASRQLLLDLTMLVRVDARTGIQRVTRSLARCLLLSPPAGYRVEPVYCDDAGDLRYARNYAAIMIGFESRQLRSEPVVAGPGDVFVGLDLNDRMFPMSAPGATDSVLGPTIERLRSSGVSCQIVVYDLLAAYHPDWFPWPHHWFPNYLSRIARRSDGLLCISQSTAHDVERWITDHGPGRTGMPIDWWHLGADIESSVPSDHVTPGFEARWAQRGSGPSILMVGTIEPRKAHDQALAAFSELWRRGVTANLVIVGQPGWGRAELAEELRKHPEWDKRLLWFQGASDAELLQLYQRSDGCLMASRGEGFGLPMIEAARYDIPVLARNLSVFSEIAGDNVTYFSTDTGHELADSLETWFAALADGTAPRSGGIGWLTWDESTQQFLAALERNLSR